MSLKPQSILDAFHKASSFLAMLGAGLYAVPHPSVSPWGQLLLLLSGALGGIGVVGNVAGKQ